STLLLDDLGLCLLRQLSEAWESCEEYARTAHTHTYGTSQVGLSQISAHYDALITAYIDHLRFVLSQRPYWPRLIHKLSIEINIGEELLRERRDLFVRWTIAEKSVQAYQQFANHL